MTFYLANTNPTNSNTVEIIRAIAELWPIVLFALLFAFILIFRKQIQRSFEKLTNFRIKKGDAELFIETPECTTIATKALPGEPEEKSKDENLLSEDHEEGEDVEPYFLLKIHDSIQEGNIEEAERIFLAQQDLETQSEEKFENELTYNFFLFTSGHQQGIDRLEELADSNNTESIALQVKAFRTISNAYHFVKNYEIAKQKLNHALSICNNDKDLVSLNCLLSKILFDSGRVAECENLLFNTLEKVANKELHFQIYQALSDRFDKEEMHWEKAVALEHAIQIKPSSKPLRFSAAYAFSEAGFDELAMWHYSKLLQMDPNYSSARNNIGISFSRLGMDGHSISSYKMAMKLSETLPFSNYSVKLIEIGDFDRAEEILQEALKSGAETHPNIHANLNNLRQCKNNEKEKATKVGKAAERKRNFIIQHAIFGQADSLLKDDIEKHVYKASSSDVNDVDVIVHSSKKLEVRWKAQNEGDYSAKLYRLIADWENVIFRGTVETEDAPILVNPFGRPSDEPKWKTYGSGLLAVDSTIGTIRLYFDWNEYQSFRMIDLVPNEVIPEDEDDAEMKD